MTETSRDYRVRVGKSGADSLGSTGTDFTFATTGSAVRLADLQRWGGQKVRPTKGQVESETWTVKLNETSTGLEITSKLATTDGRPDLLRRLIDLSVRPSTDGSWSSTHVQATGRIKDVLLDENVAEWQFVALDEQLILRETEIFTGVSTTAGPTSTTGTNILRGTTTTQVLPMGRKTNWGGRPIEAADTGEITFRGSSHTRIKLDKAQFITPAVADALKDDIRGDHQATVNLDAANDPRGAFNTLVAETTDGNKEILGTDLIQDGEIGRPPSEQGGFPNVGERIIEEITLAWGSSDRPSAGSKVQVSLYAPQHEPSDAIPKHIGSTGTHPVQLAKDIMDAVGTKTDSTQFDALVADKSFPDVTFRITGPENAARWLEEHIWKPFNLVPAINQRGEISPIKTTLPAATGADAVPDVNNLARVTSTEIRDQHPTWDHISNEQVTRVEYEWEDYNDFALADVVPPGRRELAADLLDPRDLKRVKEHDRFEEFGQRTEKISLDGLHDALTVARIASAFADEVFSRFGDGPVRSRVQGLTSLESVELGDHVLIDNVPTYPNLKDQSRGGTRLLQVVNKRFTAAGPEFEFLDAGSSNQPLSKPTVTVSLSTSRPRHVIDVTVTGLDSGAKAHVQHNQSSSTPGTTDPGWEPALVTSSTQAVEDDGLAAGSTYFYRAKQVKRGRIGSLWSALDSTATDSLPTPTGVSASSITGCKATIKWTVGSTEYPLELGIDQDDPVTTLQAGAEAFRVHDGNSTEMRTGSTLTAKVRHVDDFGAQGPDATTTFTLSTDPDQCDALIGGGILVGEETESAAT